MSHPLRASPLLVSALCVAACAARAPRLPEVERLDEQGEVYVYLQPLPGDARRLSLSVASIAARGPGGNVPLERALTQIGTNGIQHQRLLAFGRLPPGKYDGLELTLAKASVRTAEGMTDLLVGEGVARVDVAFTIERRRATTIWMSIGEQKLGDPTYSFSRTVSAVVAVPPNPQLVGYCASAGSHALFLFDKHLRQVAAVFPTSRRPTGLSLDSIRGRVYAALQRDDEVEITDTTSRNVVARVTLRPGDAPRDLALVRAGSLLFVVNEGSNSVSLVDVGAAVEIGRIPVGDQPWSIVADRGGARAYVVSRRDQSITALDAATRAAVGTVSTEPEPMRAAIDRSGTRLYVVHRGSLNMAIYTLPGLALERQVFVGAPASFVKVDARTDLVYVALADEPRVEVFDPLSLIPITAIDVASPVSYMAIDDVENAMFMVMPGLRAVSVMDLTSRKQLAVMDVGAEPHAVVVERERQ